MLNKKHFFLLLGSLVAISLLGQKQTTLKTSPLGGIFDYGKTIEKGPIGLVYVYPETDSTILFFIDVSRGAPSYNMGNLYGRLKVKSNAGIFSRNVIDSGKSCKLEFKFQNSNLVISTIEENDNCSFGYGVLADGVYKRKSRKIPSYFISMTGEKHYFKKANPETWQND